MKVLAIDTAASFCAAALLDTDVALPLGRCVRDIGKGHVEQLMEVIAEALGTQGFAGIDRIGVATGPGSFTGVRVGVSAARGLALSLEIPVAGVSVLDAIAMEAAASATDKPVFVAITAGRGEAYWSVHDPAGQRIDGPGASPLAELEVRLSGKDWLVAGNAARQIAGSLATIGPEIATADILTYARLAARADPSGVPAPLYLRRPDAKPQTAFAIARTVR